MQFTSTALPVKHESRHDSLIASRAKTVDETRTKQACTTRCHVRNLEGLCTVTTNVYCTCTCMYNARYLLYEDTFVEYCYILYTCTVARKTCVQNIFYFLSPERNKLVYVWLRRATYLRTFEGTFVRSYVLNDSCTSGSNAVYNYFRVRKYFRTK